MLDLLDDLSRLKSVDLRLQDLALHGVPFGCAASNFPTQLVRQVALAPIVKSSSWSREHGVTYRDAAGHELSLPEVIADALKSGGVLNFAGDVSFRFKDGFVVGFAIYGRALNFFQYIQSYENFAREFAGADLVKTKEAFGDLMGYEHYYSRSKKFVEWDEMGKKIVVVSLGAGRDAASDA